MSPKAKPSTGLREQLLRRRASDPLVAEVLTRVWSIVCESPLIDPLPELHLAVVDPEETPDELKAIPSKRELL